MFLSYEDIEKAVHIQKKAYELLMWLKDRARQNPSIWKQMPFAQGTEWSGWVEQRVTSFPEALRPEPGEIESFAFFLSSFFETSFRITANRPSDDWGEPLPFHGRGQLSLARGARPKRGRRNKRSVEAREIEAAQELRRFAVGSLADEVGIQLNTNILAEVEPDDQIWKDIALWTYGQELVRRTQFASQGPVVHRLWLSVDEKARRNLTAQKIWEARTRVANWLRQQANKRYGNGQSDNSFDG